MAIYVPISPVPLQFMDGNGDPLSGATLSFFLSGTSTPTNLFSDNIGTSIGSSITTNSRGYPESGGNVITLFRDTSVDIKIELDDGSTVFTSDGLNSELDVLASTANGEGASLVSIEDTAGNFTATDVEGALAEVYTDFASTSNALGASLVGVEDSAGDYTGTDVEAVLVELAPAARAASTTQTGVVELATSAETYTGTDTGRSVTPDGLAATIGAMKVSSWGTSNTILSQGGILESATVADGDQTGEATVTTGITMTDANNLVIMATPDHVADPGGDSIQCDIEFVTTTTFSIQVHGADDTPEDGHTVHIMVMRVGA